MSDPVRVRVLEIEVTQTRPCLDNQGACMVVTTSRARAVQLPTRHVCNDARARQAKLAVEHMVGEAREQGFVGDVTAHFPPGTYGAHVMGPNGKLVPVANPRFSR
jgi:hypothetical protein